MDTVSEVEDSGVVMDRGDTVAGSENRVPKCTVGNGLSEVESIGVVGGGAVTSPGARTGSRNVLEEIISSIGLSPEG